MILSDPVFKKNQKNASLGKLKISNYLLAFWKCQAKCFVLHMKHLPDRKLQSCILPLSIVTHTKRAQHLEIQLILNGLKPATFFFFLLFFFSSDQPIIPLFCHFLLSHPFWSPSLGEMRGWVGCKIAQYQFGHTWMKSSAKSGEWEKHNRFKIELHSARCWRF